MVRLLILTSTFPRWKNDSTPAFVYRIAKALSKKITVVVLAPYSQGAKLKEKAGRLTIYRFKYWFDKKDNLADGAIMANLKKRPWLVFQLPFFLLSQLIAAVKIINKEHISTIQAGWIIPQGLTALIINRLLKVKYLLTVFGGDMFPFKTHNCLWLWLYKLIINQAGYVTTVNPSFLTALTSIGQPNVVYIPNMTKLNRLKYKSKTKNILFVGRLVEKKGLAYLIKSLVLIKPDLYSQLIVVGDGPLKLKLKQQVKDLNLNSKVSFLGQAPFDQLVKLYQQSLLLVAPSITPESGDIEGFPTVYVDAMANNCPIITTDIEGAGTMIEHKQTGLIVKQKNSTALAKAISLLINNSKLRNTLAKNALQQAKQKYSETVVSRQYLKIINQI